jgi:hypothetical protein
MHVSACWAFAVPDFHYVSLRAKQAQLRQRPVHIRFELHAAGTYLHVNLFLMEAANNGQNGANGMASNTWKPWKPCV